MTARTKVVRRLVELAKSLHGEVLPYSDGKAVVISVQTFNAIQQCGMKLVMIDTASAFCRPQPKDTGTGA